MTVLFLPARGRWVWDARDRGRAVRVTSHGEVGLLNLSVWRDETCVGTVKLRPDEAAELVGALSAGLAELAADRPPAAPDPGAVRLAVREQRLADMESRLAPPSWRRVATDAGTAAVALADRFLRRRG